MHRPLTILLLCSQCAWATTYTVPGDFATMALAEAGTTTGDIIRVASGYYNLSGTLTVDVDGSGTALANRRVFVSTTEGGAILNGQVDITGDYTWFIGFTVTNNNSNDPGFRVSDNTIGVEIRDCRVHGTAGENIALYAGVHSYRIIGNDLDKPSVSGYPTFESDANASIWMRGFATSPVTTNGLIAYNTMDNTPDYIIIGGSWLQVLNNVAKMTNLLVVPHVDGTQADGGASNVLIEAYMHYNNRSDDNHFNHYDVTTAYRIIQRFNVIASKGGQGFYTTDNDRVYNHTYYSNNYTTAQLQIGAGNADVNDLGIFNCLFYFSNPASGGTGIGSLNANNFRTNNGSYGQPSWSETGSVTTDPLFTSQSPDGITLQSGSPARGAGRYITLANGTGSTSTALTVDDAWGLYPGDAILVGGVATTVANRTSGTAIVLGSAISWSDNATVVLAKNANSDIGALPYGSVYLTAATFSATSATTYVGSTTGDYRWFVWYEDGIPRETDTTSPSYTSSGGTVTAKAYSLWAQTVPVVPAVQINLPTARLGGGVFGAGTW